MGEGAEDGGVSSAAPTTGRAAFETSLPGSWRGAGCECCEVVELWELLSNEVAGCSTGEGTGEIEGRVGKELSVSVTATGPCRPPAVAATVTASMHGRIQISTATSRTLI